MHLPSYCASALIVHHDLSQMMGSLSASTGPEWALWLQLKRLHVSSCDVGSQEMGVGVRSLLCIGAHRLWVGLACGNVRVFDLAHKPQLLGHWHAHDAAVVSAVQAGPRVYTLGRDGSIRGWNAASPSADDDEARCVPGALVHLSKDC